MKDLNPVSYTHLDVYKRQQQDREKEHNRWQGIDFQRNTLSSPWVDFNRKIWIAISCYEKGYSKVIQRVSKSHEITRDKALCQL